MAFRPSFQPHRRKNTGNTRSFLFFLQVTPTDLDMRDPIIIRLLLLFFQLSSWHSVPRSLLFLLRRFSRAPYSLLDSASPLRCRFRGLLIFDPSSSRGAMIFLLSFFSTRSVEAQAPPYWVRYPRLGPPWPEIFTLPEDSKNLILSPSPGEGIIYPPVFLPSPHPL